MPFARLQPGRQQPQLGCFREKALLSCHCSDGLLPPASSSASRFGSSSSSIQRIWNPVGSSTQSWGLLSIALQVAFSFCHHPSRPHKARAGPPELWYTKRLSQFITASVSRCQIAGRVASSVYSLVSVCCVMQAFTDRFSRLLPFAPSTIRTSYRTYRGRLEIASFPALHIGTQIPRQIHHSYPCTGLDDILKQAFHPPGFHVQSSLALDSRISKRPGLLVTHYHDCLNPIDGLFWRTGQHAAPRILLAMPAVLSSRDPTPQDYY